MSPLFLFGSLPDVEDLKQSANITSARKQLALMYSNGDKVKKDLSKSYMWYLIYNENKRDFSSVEQQINIDAIKNLETKIALPAQEKIRREAELQIGRKLSNIANLYTPDLN